MAIFYHGENPLNGVLNTCIAMSFGCFAVVTLKIQVLLLLPN